MAVVAGVLLDHVDHDPAQRHRLTAALSGDVERGRRGHGLAGVLALGPPARERLGDVGRVDVVEVAVRVVLRAVQGRRVLAAQRAPEPAALHLRLVPDQAQERKGGGRHGPLAQLRVVQAVALHRQRRPVVVEPGVEHRPLAGAVGRVGPFRGHGRIIPGRSPGRLTCGREGDHGGGQWRGRAPMPPRWWWAGRMGEAGARPPAGQLARVRATGRFLGSGRRRPEGFTPCDQSSGANLHYATGNRPQEAPCPTSTCTTSKRATGT